MLLLVALVFGSASVKPVTLGDDMAGCYRILLRGPQSRLAALAADAAQKFLPFDPASAPADVTARELDVVAIPGQPLYRPYSGWDVTPPVTHIVLKTKAGVVVQPLKVEPFPYEWTNAMGGKFTSGGAVARFPLASIPAGDVDVVIVSAQGPYQRTLKAKDRDRVR
jgi:hypothetical protein